MTELQAVVENEAGIHCRPSSEILLKCNEFSNCCISVSTENGDVELNSILSLISLGIAYGETVTVKTDGENEELACRTIADLFAYHFDFPLKENN